MGLMDLFSELINGPYSYGSSYFESDEEPVLNLDMESVIEWLQADDFRRAEMELAIGPDGKLVFQQAAEKLGFFDE